MRIYQQLPKARTRLLSCTLDTGAVPDECSQPSNLAVAVWLFYVYINCELQVTLFCKHQVDLVAVDHCGLTPRLRQEALKSYALTRAPLSA